MLGKLVIATFLLIAVPATAVASGPSTLPGTWRKLPTAPLPLTGAASAWTGKQLIVYGRREVTARDARGNPYVVKSVEVAEAYAPAANAWRKLSPPAGPGYDPGYRSVWTGSRLLVFGAFHSVAYNPATGIWRTLPKALPGGIVVWTGREAIGWGGGCCGDATASGAAYDPATGRYRGLPRSPLAPAQDAVGAWTGRELILFVDGLNPATGKPYPASFARAASYTPATNTWRRLAPMPVRRGGVSAWDGRELLVVGAGKGGARSAYAYNPASNRWRALAPLPSGRTGGSPVWTGRRLLLLGGQTGRFPKLVDARHGLAYDPGTNRWSQLPKAPLAPRADAAVAWTGRSALVFGGSRGVCNPGCNTVTMSDGAAFTPAGSAR